MTVQRAAMCSSSLCSSSLCLLFPLALHKLVKSEYLIKLVISTQKSERRKEAEVKRL